MKNSFLFQYLKSDYIANQFYHLNAGGTQKFLSLSIVRNLKIPAPQTPEQQKIADFLGATDEWIENLRAQKENLESYKKGIMQKIFSQQIRFKDERGKAFPKWEEKKLGEVADFYKGIGISKDDVVEGGKNKCIRYGELYTEYNEIINEVESKTNVAKTDSFLSKKNDVLIPSSGETALDIASVSCVTEDDILLGGDLNVIRLRQNQSGEFFAYYLSNFQNKSIAKLAQGNSVVHLYASHLKTLKLNLPSFHEQQKIADFLTSVDKVIESKQQQITQAETWKKGLMQGLFV